MFFSIFYFFTTHKTIFFFMSHLLRRKKPGKANYVCLFFHVYVLQECWTVFSISSINWDCFVSNPDVAGLFSFIFNDYLWDQTLPSITLCAHECDFENETVDWIQCINCILLVIMLNGLFCAWWVGRWAFAKIFLFFLFYITRKFGGPSEQS